MKLPVFVDVCPLTDGRVIYRLIDSTPREIGQMVDIETANAVRAAVNASGTDEAVQRVLADSQASIDAAWAEVEKVRQYFHLEMAKLQSGIKRRDEIFNKIGINPFTGKQEVPNE
jgi:hypothetical protein